MPTKQNMVILDILQNSHGHLTADEIYKLAKAEMPSIAVGTVYRNLNIMAEKKQIKRIEVPNKPDIFDKTVSEHHHLICQCCGKVSDIQLMSLQDELENLDGEVLSINVNINYICPNCK